MKNDPAYAHGSDWDEVNEQSCPFDWRPKGNDDDLDDYFDDEEEDLDDEDSDFDDYL